MQCALQNDRRMPLSLCLGIGSSQEHISGKNPLSLYVRLYFPVFTDLSFHCSWEMRERQDIITQAALQTENQASAELRVGNKEPGFTMEFWGEPPEIYNLSLQSPTGEILDISASLGR